MKPQDRRVIRSSGTFQAARELQLQHSLRTPQKRPAQGTFEFYRYCVKDGGVQNDPTS